jgi:hypothetical protein
VDLLIIGQQVTRIEFDYAVTLIFIDGSILVIETGLEISRAGEMRRINADGFVEHSAAILDVLHAVLVSGDIDSNGKLILNFDNGTSFLIPANPDYEAWNFCSPEGLRMVCSPGGGVVKWT